MNSKIKIILATLTLEDDKSNLIKVDEMSDGLDFQFKNGVNLMFTHPSFPQPVKRAVSAMLNASSKNSVEVDLTNWKNPVKYIVNK